MLTAWVRARELRRAVERHGLEALGVVRANGAADDEEERLVRGADADGLLVADCKVDVSMHTSNAGTNKNALSVGRMYKLWPGS